jgi:hypothetical protein
VNETLASGASDGLETGSHRHTPLNVLSTSPAHSHILSG